jgi:uncharacterized protein (DUF2252 family)
LHRQEKTRDYLTAPMNLKHGDVRPSERKTILTARRRLKMARSAHAYVRGNTLKFYEWLENCSRGLVPEGPPVWICGDCHVGNVGPVANVDGKVEIQIRDLDQTVVGNPSHDLIRLSLSLATAARGSDLPGVTTAHMMEQMIAGYLEAFNGQTGASNGNGPLPAPLRFVLKQALSRKWSELAPDRMENGRPTIPLGKRFWKLARDERRDIERLFAADEARQLVTALKHRDDDAPVRVVDAAYWVKGCSSLGLMRYAVLVQVGKKEDGQFAIMDIKEAVQAATPGPKPKAMPRSNGDRVVEGARHISPFLGKRMISAQICSRSVFVRELLPQDLKLEMDHVNVEDAVAAARCLASVLGRAHARQMDESIRKEWCAELGRQRSKKLDAPSWLWTSVVDLIASHETAYLDHCRLYALEPGSRPTARKRN